MSIMAASAVIPVAATELQGPSDWRPFFNLRLLSFAVVALSLYAASRLSEFYERRLKDAEKDAAPILLAVVNMLIVWGVTVEIYLASSLGGFPDPLYWQPGALFMIASFWGIYALGLVRTGLSGGRRLLWSLGMLLVGFAAALALFTSI